MPIQTATTADLEKASKIMLGQMRYTAEYNMPTSNLVEHFTLGKGSKQMTIPKGGQMTAQDLVDGQDLIDSEDITLTTTDLTTAEVGLKVIVTDKLLHDFNEDVFRMVGRLQGDAMARKKERSLQGQ